MTATRACSVEECERPAKGKRDWCAMHTERWRRWGDPVETRPRVRGICTEPGCERPHEARGLCSVHYYQANRPAPKPRARLSSADRLARRIDKSAGPDACWLWTGTCNDRGYGHTYIWRGDRKLSTSAHRAAYIEAHGPIPDELLVRHLCNNPPCCNPSHLRLGDQVQNMADRRTTGAGYATGAAAPTAVEVSLEMVAAIRAEYRPRVKGRGQHALAQRFGLSRTTIQRIVTATDRWAESA